MFTRAFGIARSFTRPVVVSVRKVSGEIGSSVGRFVVLNADGWILTAAHVVMPLPGMLEEVLATREKLEQLAAIEAGPEPAGFKKAMIKKLNLGKDSITHVSPWWGQDGAVLAGAVVIDPLADLAVVRLDGLNTEGVTFPCFKRLNPEVDEGIQGHPLLKIGFPFASIATAFDEISGRFSLDLDGGMALFPLDGVLTRTVRVSDESSGRVVHFLETSSPGLKGQSGGPTVDEDGVVWAIQSRTITLDLDFVGRVQNARDGVRQFINVGWGSHPANIAAVLDGAGIDVSWI